MTISIDWDNKIVESTASIPDIVSFKDTLRDFEDDAVGMIHDPIITYKKLNLGGGGFFHAVDFINGYQLKFPNAGDYLIIGNIGAAVVPVAGVFVDRTTSASFASFASGSGVTAQDKIDIADAVWLTTTRALTETVSLTPAQLVLLTELWKLSGLDATNPMTVTPTTRVTGAIDLVITGDGETTSTVTRQ